MKKRVNSFWLGLSVLLSLTILVLCVYAGRGGALVLEPQGDPQTVVSSFFDALIAGRYSDAYACLNDYSGLGLENQPTDTAGRTLYRALRESYAYTLLGDCAVDKLSASQAVIFQSLNVKAVQAAVAERIEAVTQRLVEEMPSSEIYDEDMQYLPSFTDTVYETALNEVLEDAEAYYTDVTLMVALSYQGERWSMATSPALIGALLGGA